MTTIDTKNIVPATNTPATEWVVEPGKEVKISASYNYATPASWALLAPTSYMVTPTSLRAEIFIKSRATTETGYNITTPWQTVLVGYMPPAEAAK